MLFGSFLTPLGKLNIQKNEVIYLAAILLLFVTCNLYYIFYFPIYIDEAHTFYWFTSKGLFSSATFYPAPNNHILYSLISNIFHHLPFDPKINIRIPNLLLGAFTSILVYFILRKTFNPLIAVLPHAVFTFSYPTTFYSIFGRGYMLCILFTCICFFCITKLKEEKRTRYFLGYSVASVLGFYTIPTFLYISISFIVYIFLIFYNDSRALWRLFRYHLLIACAVLILYFPIIWFNGLNSLTNNQFTKPISFREVLNYLKNNYAGFYNILLGIRTDFIMFPFLFSLLFLLLKIKNQKTVSLIVFVLLFFIMPFIILPVHQVIPGPRVWSYLIFPFVLGLGVILNYIANGLSVKPFYFYAILVPVIIIQLYIFHKSHPHAALPQDHESDQITSLVLQKKYHSFYFNSRSSGYPYVILKYNYLKTNNLFFANPDFTGLFSPKEDSLSLENYDCIVWRKDYLTPDFNIPSNFSLIYKQNDLLVFGNNRRL